MTPLDSLAAARAYLDEEVARLRVNRPLADAGDMLLRWISMLAARIPETQPAADVAAMREAAAQIAEREHAWDTAAAIRALPLPEAPASALPPEDRAAILRSLAAGRGEIEAGLARHVPRLLAALDAAERDRDAAYAILDDIARRASALLMASGYKPHS